jgi:aminopeptidase N
LAEIAPTIVRLADYETPTFLIDSVDLAFDLDARETRVLNRMGVRRAEGAPAAAPLRLDGVNLTLTRLALDGEILASSRYSLDETGLTITDLPAAFRLDIETLIHPDRNSSKTGLMEIGGKLVTQCEAEGFRKLTYFPDRPDVLAVYSVTLRADKATYPVLLSNGDLVGRGVGADGRHWAAWRDPYPKPCYIFAIVAGDFGCLREHYVTASGRTVTVGVYADHDLIETCQFAMEVAIRALRWDEETYGLEYDLDTFNIVAVSGWSGAMENKGLNLFGASGVIADPDISTDEDYIIIERIIGHEEFHNWTGNRVTCRDWFQLCLKEGLTRFRDQQFIEDKLSSGVWRIESVKQLRRNQFPEDDGPAAHPVKPAAYAEIDNFYTNTIYDKGAEVVRMIRALLGPETFRRGFDLYIQRHDGRAVTTEAFLQAMEDASGRDLAQFRLWYSQAGRPRVRARGAYDAAHGRYAITLTQSCPPTPGQADKAPFHIPIVMGLLSKSGEALTFRTQGANVTEPVSSTVMELTGREQTFAFEGVASPPIASLLRGFSAPVTLESETSAEDLAVLTKADPDPFARWDASQTLAIRIIRDLAAARSAGRPMTAPSAFVEAIGAVLEDDASDPLLRGLILSLPDEPVLSEGLASIDLDGHIAARNLLRLAIATRFQDRLLARYHALAETGPYAPNIAGIGRRRLKNVILDLLTALDTAEIAELCLAQLTGSANMTDSFEALCLLTHVDRPQGQQGVDWFYDRWKDHGTVIDKWFNAQALSRAPGAVDKIIALEQHPAYDIGNFSQGLVYYGGFFRQNRVAFHDPSGKGYEFLADRLLMIDRMGRSGSHYIMPQINQWRRYDPARQALMRQALERVAASPGLSKGLRENITKALI